MDDEYCSIYYTVESCDLSNNTCEMSYREWYGTGQWDYYYTSEDCGSALRDDEWWEWQQNNTVWFNASRPELYYVWEYWDDYHHGSADIDTDEFHDWFWEEYGEDLGYNDTVSIHEHPLCGNSSWYTTSTDCDYFPAIEYRETCYIQYSYDPCNMSDFTCYMPHYDMNGDWQYADCSNNQLDYEIWSSIRTHPFWHDREHDAYLVYVHEFWD